MRKQPKPLAETRESREFLPRCHFEILSCIVMHCLLLSNKQAGVLESDKQADYTVHCAFCHPVSKLCTLSSTQLHASFIFITQSSLPPLSIKEKGGCWEQEVHAKYLHPFCRSSSNSSGMEFSCITRK